MFTSTIFVLHSRFPLNTECRRDDVCLNTILIIYSADTELTPTSQIILHSLWISNTVAIRIHICNTLVRSQYHPRYLWWEIIPLDRGFRDLWIESTSTWSKNADHYGRLTILYGCTANVFEMYHYQNGCICANTKRRMAAGQIKLNFNCLPGITLLQLYMPTIL